MKFFRKVRQNLLTENKFTKYLVYALGEIVLVVIGILIALGINNTNEQRKLAAVEQTYLVGLREEFQTSKLKLQELINVNQQNYLGAKTLLGYIANPNQSPTELQFSSLLYTTFSAAIDFNPNNSLLYEMVNSGNLKNISNAELRRQLTNWISRMEDISRQEAELGVQREKVLDMFKNDAHSLGTIFKHAGVYTELDLPKTENETSNLSLLQSTAFENNILMFIITSYATEKAHYNPLMKHLNDILSLLEKEIEP